MYDYKVDVYAMGFIFLEIIFKIRTKSELNEISEALKNSSNFPVTFSQHSQEVEVIGPNNDMIYNTCLHDFVLDKRNT